MPADPVKKLRRLIPQGHRVLAFLPTS
jgi:hypothetical protein